MQLPESVGSDPKLAKSFMKGTLPIGMITILLSFGAWIDSKYSTKEALNNIEKQIIVERDTRLDEKRETNEKLNLIIRILTKTKE